MTREHAGHNDARGQSRIIGLEQHAVHATPEEDHGSSIVLSSMQGTVKPEHDHGSSIVLEQHAVHVTPEQLTLGSLMTPGCFAYQSSSRPMLG